MRHIIRRISLPFSLVMLSFVLSASLPQGATGSWGSANSMASLHDGGCAVVLQDGRILVGGGSDASGASTKVEIFNTDGSWSAAPPMLSPRTHQVCAALQDGQVLVAGGITTGGGITNSVEMFDPNANTWSQLSPMSEARAGAATSVLQDGRVLLAGGQTTAGPSNSMEIFDPNTQTFNFAGTMSASRQDTAAVLLQDGRVLIVGGSGVDANGNPVILGSSDIYDPGTGSVSAGPSLVTARSKHSATMQLDGKVVVIGGNDGSNDLAGVEVYDPIAAGNFNLAAASLATPRSGHLAFLLPKNNEVLVVGGQSAGADLASAELYVPWGNQCAGAVQSTGSMSAARSQASGAPLSAADGLLLVAGGSSQASAELYNFATLSTDQSDYAPGTTVIITGGGWQPGETVTLTLVESPLIDTHPVMTAVADQNGNIFNNQFSPDTHDVNVRFYLTATGSQSQAQNTFTDGNVTSVGGTVKSSSAGNAAIAGATITCTSGCNNNPPASTTSGTSGAYVFNNNTTKLSFGTNGPVTLTLTASAPGFNSAMLTLTNVSNGDTLTGKDFLLSPAGTAPTITSANNTTFNVNSPGSFTVTSRGSPAPTFSETGTLPAGVTFTSAGLLSGTPALGTVGTFPITVTASNGVSPNATQSFTLIVGMTNATVTLGNLNQTYSGSPVPVTTTTNPSALSVTVTYNGSSTVPTNAGTYSVLATVSDPNYTGSASGTLVIGKASATVAVTAYSATYDGNAHTATGTATGVKGEALSGLDLSGTTHSNAGDYLADPWTFTDSTGNYNDASGTVHDAIAKANATVNVTPYSLSYDGNSHTATGTATGVKGEALSGLDLSGTTHTNAGEYAADPWTFTDSTGNYSNDNGTVHDAIAKANATVNVTPYSVTYDGNSHTATGAATGVKGEALSGLDLSGTTHTNAGDYPVDAWTFTDSTGNYNPANGTVHDAVAKANPAVNVAPYSVTYDGNAHTATGSATGVKNESLAGLDLSGTTHTNAGDYVSDPWIFTDSTGNYNNASGTVHDAIAKANPTVNVAPYSVTYDGNAHTATGSATGVKNESLAGLDLSGTTHTNAGDYQADAWTFTDSTGNYNNASGTVHDAIAKANPAVNVAPYSVTYDGNAHAATGSATGVKNESLAGLDLSGTTHTNAGDYPADAWSFTDSTGNYNNASGSVNDVINQANATINVDGYTGVYDGNPHGGSGTASGVKGEDLSSLLSLGSTFTDVPGGTANWAFTGNTNYKSANGNAVITLTPAPANITVTGYTGRYDGNAHGATGSVLGVKGENLSSLLNLGAKFTDVPGGTANWTFAGNINYQSANGSVQIVINKADSTVTITVASVTFDGNPHGGTAAVTGVGGLNQSLVPNYAGTMFGGAAYVQSQTPPTHAGTYQLSANFAGDNNHNPSNDSMNFTIFQAGSSTAVTVAGGASFTYDSTPHPATVSVTGAGGLNQSPTPLYSCGHVPTYAADSGCMASYSFTGDNDHTVSSGGLTYSIARAPLVATANSVSMVLGAPLPQLTGSLVGVLGADSISTTYTTAATGTVIGTFPVTPVLSDPNNRLPNYTLTSNKGILTVQYAAAGLCYGDYGHQILPPIAASGASTFKQRSTIPAKFRVCDALGNSIGAPNANGVPVVAQFSLIGIINGTVTQTVDETVASTNPDTAFRWDPTSQQWIFNISTSNLLVGATYVYQISLNDGTSIRFQYGLPR